MIPDFVDRLRASSDHRVEAIVVGAIVVGAHALAAHGHVRATKDLAVWIRPSKENAARAHRALTEFGASLTDLGVADLSTPGTVFQIEVDPVRIDIITEIDDEAPRNRRLILERAISTPKNPSVWSRTLLTWMSDPSSNVFATEQGRLGNAEQDR